jgi:ubiquinone/menaquinone biosynthesis C-methylase UbiE
MRAHAEHDAPQLRALAPNELVSRLALTIGFRDWAYRKRAVHALGLGKGAKVVEIGCGTGRNFALLEQAVGREGHIVAVDVSRRMLAHARKRAERREWSNIELVLTDAAEFDFPAAVDGVLSTYTLVVVPEYDRVIERACHALKVGARVAVLDQKLPTGLAAAFIPVLDFLSRSIEYSKTLRERQLWESIRRHAGNVHVEEEYFGFVYMAVGEKRATSQP